LCANIGKDGGKHVYRIGVFVESRKVFLQGAGNVTVDIESFWSRVVRRDGGRPSLAADCFYQIYHLVLFARSLPRYFSSLYYSVSFLHRLCRSRLDKKQSGRAPCRLLRKNAHLRRVGPAGPHGKWPASGPQATRTGTRQVARPRPVNLSAVHAIWEGKDEG